MYLLYHKGPVFSWCVTCNNFNTGMSALPDMYARSPCSPRASGIHIRQTTSACVTTNMLHFRHSKIWPNLTLIFPSAYIIMDSDYDCGS